LSDSIERGGESSIRGPEHELDAVEPLAEAHCEVAGQLHRPLARRVRGDAAEVHPAGAVLDRYQDVQSLQQHGVHVQEVHREDPGGLRMENCRHVGPVRRGAGSMPAARRISHTVDGDTAMPSLASSQWMRRCPQSDSPSPGERQGGRY
jgi:hypothetical protein